MQTGLEMKRKATSKLPATPNPALLAQIRRVSFAVSGPVFGWLVKVRSAWQHDAGLRGMAMRAILGAVLFAFGVMWLTAASAQEPVLSDNASSIAVVVGNRDYKQTSAVDFAHNDADAIKAWLTGTLGFREQNVFLLKDATLGELNQAFGSEANPQGGRLWRSVSEGRSNVFVYYSGHGVPDIATRQPFLLPQDGSPGSAETGYALQTLYRNLELVRQKIGPQRQVIVMIDACFTGETGRKGESLLAVSAPGFTPAKPRSGNGIVKLVATSGATPANWDQETKLGLFTSRFLMGVAGLAGGSQGKAVALPDLKRYVIDSVTEAAQRENRREQIPEIDEASVSLPVGRPVPAVAGVFAAVRDEAAWQRARKSGERLAFEDYIASCAATCRFREEALQHLQGMDRSDQATSDRENWLRLSAAKSYADYLKGCGTVCAYKALAEGYLRQSQQASGQIDRRRGTSQRALFIQDTSVSANQPSISEQGRAFWRLDRDNIDGKKIENYARAEIEVERLNFSLDFSIRRNRDPTYIDPVFPPAYVINMRFTTMTNDTVIDVGRPEFKSDERARGVPVIADSLKQSENVFIAPMSNVPDDLTHDLNLMRNRNWIELRIRFASGRSGILRFEKGEAGRSVTTQALGSNRR